MLWLKFVLGALIIAFCTLLGYFAAGKYRSRRSFFSQLNAFNEKYLAELKFSRKPLSLFLKEFSFSGDMAATFEEFQKSRAIKVDYPYLTEAEKSFAAEYLSMLGKGDSHSQSGYFSAQAAGLSESKKKSENDAKSYTDLYVKLGLLAGLAFVILIV